MELQKRYQQQTDRLQTLSAAVLAMERAVDSGAPLTQQWAVLQGLAAADPVVAATLRSVPPHVIHTGAPPLAHLRLRFHDLDGSVTRALYLPPQASLGTHLLSSIAGAVTAVDSTMLALPPAAALENYPAPGQPLNSAFFAGVEHDTARLARARHQMHKGDLAAALTELDAMVSPHAHEAAKGLLAQLRDRVVLDQSLLLLRAHAGALYNDLEGLMTPSALALQAPRVRAADLPLAENAPSALTAAATAASSAARDAANNLAKPAAKPATKPGAQ